IIFPQLQKKELLQIVGLFQKRLNDRMIDQNMTLEFSEAAKLALIDIGFDPTLGARPLRRAVQREVEDILSEKILQGELHSGDHVTVDHNESGFTFEIRKPEPILASGAPAAADQVEGD